MNDILAEHAIYLRSPENVARLIIDLCNAEKRIQIMDAALRSSRGMLCGLRFGRRDMVILNAVIDEVEAALGEK